MTAPPPRRTIAGTAACVARNIDLRSTADDAIPVFLGRLEQVLARLDPDVVVEDVEAAPALDRRSDHGDALAGPRDVGGVGQRLAALGADEPDGLLGAVLHLVDAEDARALAGEEDRRRLAVAEARAARAGAGHDRDLAVEPGAHRPITAPSADRDSRPTTGARRRR